MNSRLNLMTFVVAHVQILLNFSVRMCSNGYIECFATERISCSKMGLIDLSHSQNKKFNVKNVFRSKIFGHNNEEICIEEAMATKWIV